MKPHKDLPPASQPWAADVDSKLSKLTELETVIRRLAENAGIDFSNPKRGVNAGPTPSVKSPVSQKLSSLADVSTYNVLDGHVLTWDRQAQQWLPKAKAGAVPYKNLWPDPHMQKQGAECVTAYNHFLNPSPVASLSSFAVKGASTVSLSPSASIKGAGGLTVVSPDAASGVTLIPNPALPLTEQGQAPLNYYPNQQTMTAYVRAHSAMSVTISASADYEMLPGYPIGWGDFGWGEPYSYVDNATYTFAEGEVKRFRMIAGVYQKDALKPAGWPRTEGVPTGLKFHVHGTGTFDLDAVGQYDWVDDGVDPAYYPGGYYEIPNCPLWFDGNSAPVGPAWFEWEGAPNASISIQKALRSAHLDSGGEGGGIHQNSFPTTLAGGEQAAELQGAWNYVNSSAHYFVGEDRNYDMKQVLSLEAGKNYCLSADLVSTYEGYFEGYPEGLWDSSWLSIQCASDDYEYTPNGNSPYRRRLEVPFPVVAVDEIWFDFTQYRNWQTGSFFLTNVAVNEIAHVTPRLTAYDTTSTIDMLAENVQKGARYKFAVNNSLRVGGYYLIEYKAGGAESPWYRIGGMTYEEQVGDYQEITSYKTFDVVIPDDTTELRFRSNPAHYTNVWAYTPPPPFQAN